ncbi:hypothetical protein [Cribrihabitans marinus]|uniref:hypothetical protein n=1 Tax=Cribrihabitans marinus TaxID=1227549 RepID=UPI0011600804|nr:hypothetical protein [Cribrihabitans marinus]GGH25057.1 hypothetical protein GCM10010973_11960 [Cribrihabitans marinus]
MRVLLFGAALCPTAPATAQEDGRALAQRALATYGLVAIPNPSTTFLTFSQVEDARATLRSGQIGGGLNPAEGLPLYLEGFAGYQRYAPEFLLDSAARDRDIDARWTAVSSTFGVGWDVPINDTWLVRPVLNLSLGRISADAQLGMAAPAGDPGGTSEFLTSGEIIAGGYGGSLMLVHKDYTEAREIDFSLRYTDMRFVTLDSSPDFNPTAQASAVTAWGRLRMPLGHVQTWDSPVRSVYQASLSVLPGDQGDAVDLDWLGRVGAGLEIGTRNTGIAYLSRARLMVSYAFGDGYDGYSVGIGMSF